MPAYSLTLHSLGRYQLTDGRGGVGSVYVSFGFKRHGTTLLYRVGISTVWSTSSVKRDADLLFLHLDESLVPGHANWNTDQHDVFATEEEALAALRTFIDKGCPGLTLTNLAAAQAYEKATKSAAKVRRATNILRGMELDDLITLRKAVDAAIAKKSPKKK